MACCFRTRVATQPPEPSLLTGDRNPDITRSFPPAAFYRNGGNVIDVTQDVSSLPGVGVPNALPGLANVARTTAAFKAAWNFIRNRINATGDGAPGRNYIPWLPAGEYFVNDTIIWDGAVNSEADNSQQFRLLGERRATTIIRLIDNALGFGAGTNKPVISNCKVDFNPKETKSPIEGVTIRIGAGNPGAVGVMWLGPNGNAIGDLTIESLDATDRGAAGIYLKGCTQFWIHDLTIRGFDVAVQSDHPHVTDNAFEHVTIERQRVAGFRAVDSCFTLRKVRSDQTAYGGSAVVTTGENSAVRIEDCEFLGGSAAQPAIAVHANSALYADNVITDGYGNRARRGTVNVVTGSGTITGYASARYSAFGSTTINRLVEFDDVPIIDWPAAGDWAVATTAAGVQAAMDSGKPGVMIRGTINGGLSGDMGTVTVPASVRFIFGCFSSVGGQFRLGAGSATPLMIKGFWDSPSVNQNGKDRLIIIEQLAGGGSYLNASPAATDKVHCVATSGWGRYTLSGPMTFFGRMINTEPKAGTPPDEGAAFTFDGARVAILGGKTESNLVSIRATGGAKVHILGFMHNQSPWNTRPENSQYINGVFDVVDSQVNATGCLNGLNVDRGYERLTTCAKSGTTKTIPFSDLRLRPYRRHQAFVDHYVDADATSTMITGDISWMVGANLAGPEFNPASLPGSIGTDYVWPTSTEVDYYAAKGFTLLRIPFRWERIQPTANTALNATYRDAMISVTDYARSKGMRVLLDMHNYWRFYDALLTQSAYVDVWTRIAAALGSRDNIILGLMNEPYGVAATTVVTGHNAVIAALRAAGYTGWCAVGGNNWEGAHSWPTANAAAFASLVADPKVLIDAHQYLDIDGTGTHASCAIGTGTLAGDGVFRLTAFTDWCRANGRKAILSEWSYTPSDTTCQSWAPAMIQYMLDNQDVWRGHCYWANFPTARGPHDGNPQLLNPLSGGIDRPQIPVLIHASKITVSWDASTDNVGVTGYELERKAGAGAFSLITTTSALSYVDTAVDLSKTYTYRVRAVDAAGNKSGYSSTVQVIT